MGMRLPLPLGEVCLWVALGAAHLQPGDAAGSLPACAGLSWGDAWHGCTLNHRIPEWLLLDRTLKLTQLHPSLPLGRLKPFPWPYFKFKLTSALDLLRGCSPSPPALQPNPQRCPRCRPRLPLRPAVSAQGPGSVWKRWAGLSRPPQGCGARAAHRHPATSPAVPGACGRSAPGLGKSSELGAQVGRGRR